MQIVRLYYPTSRAIETGEVMGFESRDRTIDRVKSPSLFKMVAQYEIDDLDERPDLEICEEIFTATNMGDDFSLTMFLRSIKAAAWSEKGDLQASHMTMSVGDVVEISGRFYVCAAFGFDRIEK